MKNLYRKKIILSFSPSKKLSQKKKYILSYIVKPLLVNQILEKKIMTFQ